MKPELWMTLEIEIGCRPEFLIRLLHRNKFDIKGIEHILPMALANLTPAESLIKLVRFSPERTYSYQDAVSAGLELGLKLCHPAVGPWLRWEYPEQTLGTHSLIAMPPLKIQDEGCIFLLSGGTGSDSRRKLDIRNIKKTVPQYNADWVFAL